MPHSFGRRFCVVLVGAGLTILSACTQAPKAPAVAGARAAVPVLTATATMGTIPVEISLVGSVEASETVQIMAQVTGKIESIHFAEGEIVKKGDVLFSIEDHVFKQALMQAEAAVARDRAAIRQAEANVTRDMAQSKHGETEMTRYSELFTGGIVSQTQFDQLRTNSDVFKATLLASQAAVETGRANWAGDIAAVEKAKIDIDYCSVRSPITGRAGAVLLHAGNIVQANATALVVVNRITPLFVTFSVPERHLRSIRELSAKGRLPVKASMKDNPGVSSTGAVSMIDNSVDPGTGSIRLKASFENREGALWPGQFANVILRLGAIEATLVPSEAVKPSQQGSFVFRVKANQTVEAVAVRPGGSYEGRIEIVDGLKPGDVVVTDGHLRLAPGTKVKKGQDLAALVSE